MRGSERGGVLRGCVMIFAVVGLLVAVGAGVAVWKWRSIAGYGLQKLWVHEVDASGLTEDEKNKGRLGVADVLNAFEAGALPNNRLQAAAARFQDARAFRGLWSDLDASDLGFPEKEPLRTAFSRYFYCVQERLLTEANVSSVNRVSVKDWKTVQVEGRNARELKEAADRMNAEMKDISVPFQAGLFTPDDFLRQLLQTLPQGD